MKPKTFWEHRALMKLRADRHAERVAAWAGNHRGDDDFTYRRRVGSLFEFVQPDVEWEFEFDFPDEQFP